MSESIIVDKSLSSEEIYISLLPQIDNLIDADEPLITNLANFTAVLKDSFAKISWVGFYLLKETKLFLGPFQGKVACTIIELGKGVCSAAVTSGETIIVDDVEKFPGHIACDAGSRSEIVIPLMKENKIFGVLDLDSYDYASFDNVDKIYLEKMCSIIASKLDLEKIELLVG